VDASHYSQSQLSLLFGAGVVAQTALYVLRSPSGLSGLGIAALAGLFGLIPSGRERSYDLHFHLMVCFLIYACTVFAQYKKEIMARVSQSSLLVNSLTFWYVCVFYLGGARQAFLMSLAALPTLGTLIVAFTVREWGFKMRLACYVWFLILAAANSSFQVRFGNLSFLFFESYAPPHALDLFLTGMSFTILFASLFYVYILIPFREKRETKEQRAKRWRADAHAMASHFVDYRMTAAQAAQIVTLQCGLYILNYWTGWVSPGVMMDVSIVVFPAAVSLLYVRPAPEAT